MRVTLRIDDDMLDAARTIANSEGITIGAAMSQLMRRGLQSEAAPQVDFPVFAVAKGAPVITPSMVADALVKE